MTPVRMFFTRPRLALVAALALGLVALFARADGAHASDVIACPAGRPCIVKLYQTVDGSIFMRWDARSSHEFDVYQVRWIRPGMIEAKTWEGEGHTYTIRNAHPGVQYHLMVQGCDRHFLAHSTCSGWSEAYITPR